MWYYLLFGGAYAFTAAIQPGPLQSYLIAQTLKSGWRSALPAACAPLISDGPIIILVVFILSTVPVWLMSVLQCIGGIFLLYLTYQALNNWRTYHMIEGDYRQPRMQTLMQAVLVNVLSPAPYLGWSLVLGPIFLKGWNDAPLNGILFLIGFYSSIVLNQIGLILLFAYARTIGPRVTRTLLACSVVVLACFGVFQLWHGLTSFF